MTDTPLFVSVSPSFENDPSARNAATVKLYGNGNGLTTPVISPVIPTFQCNKTPDDCRSIKYFRKTERVYLCRIRPGERELYYRRTREI